MMTWVDVALEIALSSVSGYAHSLRAHHREGLYEGAHVSQMTIWLSCSAVFLLSMQAAMSSTSKTN